MECNNNNVKQRPVSHIDKILLDIIRVGTFDPANTFALINQTLCYNASNGIELNTLNVIL